MKITQEDACFGLSTDSLKSLEHLLCLLRFLFFTCTRNRKKFRLQTTVRNSIIFNLDVALKEQILSISRALDQNWAPKDLNETIILYIDLASEA